MTSSPNLAERGTRIGAIGSAIQSADTRLSTVTEGVKAILRDESWREFVTARGEHVQHERFVDFVTTPMLHGLGVTVDLVRRVVADDPAALDLLDRALQGEHGGDRSANVDNSNVASRPTGTTQDQALRRLRREADAGNEHAAELRTEVLAGRLSAHQAMIRAGFRPKTVSVPIAKPESIANTLRRHMTPEQLRELRRLLGDDTS
ncbi:hypothetical protein [Parafrankia sp. FMc2]|uniref:hypothetical protein n=1 Tax=Parafrankia sp. FMc2 TaxID=3233196 RepID=UPI0034D5A950